MNIELLTEKNFTPNSLDFYNRTQIVKRVYRRQNGEYALVDMPYIEDWTLERKRLEAQFLRSSECIAYLALENGTVAGFIGLKKKAVRFIYDFEYDARFCGLSRKRHRKTAFCTRKRRSKKSRRRSTVHFRLFFRRNNSILQGDGRRNYRKSNQGICG